MMGVFNNLVDVRPAQVRQNSLDGIVPDLATKWTWSEDGKTLTFALREGVKWHDGKPFTAADVKCTLDLLAGTAQGELQGQLPQGLVRQRRERDGQRRPRGGVQPEDAAAGAAGPARLRLHAGLSVPCLAGRDAPRADRHRAVQVRRVQAATRASRSTRNPNYWKPGRPYLDGIEYTIIPNRSTAILAFVSGKFDMTFPFEITVPLVGDVKAQMPTAQSATSRR